MKLLWFVIAAMVFIAAAFFAYGSFNADEEQIKTEAYFCPADDCFSIIASLIASSQKADCAFYTLNSDKIQNALTAVNARVVADEKCPVDNCQSKPSYQRGLMHNKFCVLDDSVVVTGSFNPNEKSKSYLNNVVVLHSTGLAEEYADEFEELWEGEFGAGKKGKSKIVFFCPEDNCQKHLLEEIEKAEKSIYFMVYSFTDNEIADKLLEKEEGVIVRGFFDKAQNSKWSVYNKLEKAGLDVKVYEKAVLHHKVFIIDNETVITGSYNPTQNGNENNDENMVIIRDKTIAASFLNAFNALQS
ncbi:MAG: hypothetical protein KJ955_07855 [Nanoarchaeota archaeon]|nr:hypothetical protein [Nanoarchaeota archaeon]